MSCARRARSRAAPAARHPPPPRRTIRGPVSAVSGAATRHSLSGAALSAQQQAYPAAAHMPPQPYPAREPADRMDRCRSMRRASRRPSPTPRRRARPAGAERAALSAARRIWRALSARPARAYEPAPDGRAPDLSAAALPATAVSGAALSGAAGRAGAARPRARAGHDRRGRGAADRDARVSDRVRARHLVRGRRAAGRDEMVRRAGRRDQADLRLFVPRDERPSRARASPSTRSAMRSISRRSRSPTGARSP